jgi:hypothetical protein
MNQHKTTAQDFFLNVGVMVTLYVSVVSFLSLFFSVINKLFPDSLSYSYDPYSSGVRLAMASLIIVFPLFLWLSRTVTTLIRKETERRESAVRKWLVYITLFFASMALVIDLVTLLNYFLSGEITTRFILKVLAVLVIAGLVFWHYLSEVRGTASEAKYQAVFWISIVFVVALLIWAFSIFGSPNDTRKLRVDNQRVSDLQSIQWQIVNYWQQKGKLPAGITDLNDSLSSFSVPVDPESSAFYRYEKTGSKSFKLCANFHFANKITEARSIMLAQKSDMTFVENWQHGAGEYCFDRNIDEDLYPVQPMRKMI